MTVCLTFIPKLSNTVDGYRLLHCVEEYILFLLVRCCKETSLYFNFIVIIFSHIVIYGERKMFKACKSNKKMGKNT